MLLRREVEAPIGRLLTIINGAALYPISTQGSHQVSSPPQPTRRHYGFTLMPSLALPS
jgi:hypothetical protein